MIFLKGDARAKKCCRKSSAKNRTAAHELFIELLVVIFSNSRFLLRKKSLTKGSGKINPAGLQPLIIEAASPFVGPINWAGKRRRRSRRRKGDKVYPLCNVGGSSGLFFVFPKAAVLREGDVENDRAL